MPKQYSRESGDPAAASGSHAIDWSNGWLFRLIKELSGEQANHTITPNAMAAAVKRARKVTFDGTPRPKQDIYR